MRKQTRDGASWTLRYHFAGKQHWLTVGNFPDMSLANARIEARQARVLLDKQQNPLAVRRAALAEERQKGSFKSLCEDWYRAEVQAHGLKHPEVPKRYLDKYLIPKFGRQPACDIAPADIARLLDEIKGRAPTAANDLLPSSCCSRCACAKGSCSGHGGKSSTSTARNLAPCGACLPRGPRRARISISRWFLR